MIPVSSHLVAFVLGLGILSLIVFFAALAKGLLSGANESAHIIFDEYDLRWDRDWESRTEREARVRHQGSLLKPGPSEFGGARR